MATHRLSAVLKDIHVDDIFVVMVPVYLQWGALGNRRIIAQNKPALANVNIIEADLLPDGRVGSARSVNILQDASWSRSVHGPKDDVCWCGTCRR